MTKKEFEKKMNLIVTPYNISRHIELINEFIEQCDYVRGVLKEERTYKNYSVTVKLDDNSIVTFIVTYIDLYDEGCYVSRDYLFTIHNTSHSMTATYSHHTDKLLSVEMRGNETKEFIKHQWFLVDILKYINKNAYLD